MKLNNIKRSMLSFWNEFRQTRFGIFGLITFCLFVVIILFETAIIPFPEASTRWRDISYWEDNPKGAAPVWVNWFTSTKHTPQKVITDVELKREEDSGFEFIDVVIPYDYQYDIAPNDIIFHAMTRGEVTLMISLLRPDGDEILLTEKSVNSTTLRDLRIPISTNSLDNVYNYVKQHESFENIKAKPKNVMNSMQVLFAKAEEGMLQNPASLQGEYQLKVTAVILGEGEFLEPNLVISGNVFGLLGTDSFKRDIWSGVIAGTKWAMLIGLMTSSLAVIIGVIFGVSSAYFGGLVDMLMMRFYEIAASIPMLPVLIVLSAIFKPSIWTIILIMCVFSWVGPVRTVRSIGLQIKAETYVEAARALNASHSRIIFRHMIPQLIPYAFASMALSVPGAIVTESTISLLGLGDPTIVTWGQILRDAVSGGAVLQGLWWWVVPPGLFIAGMGMTFAFIGFAMDTILNPKLKTR